MTLGGSWRPPELVVDFSRRRIDPFVAHAAGNKVFAFIRMTSRGKGSGALVEAHVANVWTFRDGKVIEFAYFGEDRAAAVEAAGLPG